MFDFNQYWNFTQNENSHGESISRVNQSASAQDATGRQSSELDPRLTVQPEAVIEPPAPEADSTHRQTVRPTATQRRVNAACNLLIDWLLEEQARQRAERQEREGAA